MKKKKTNYINIKELQILLRKNNFSSSYSYIINLLKEKSIKGEKIDGKWQFERKYIQ